jgi:ribosomal protein S16
MSMNRLIGKGAALLGALLLAAPAFAANQPYTSASYVSGAGVDEVASQAKAALTDAGFDVVGSYHPVGNDNMAAVVVTDDRILKAIGKLRKTTKGGYPVAGAGIRVGVYKPKKKDQVEVSFMNPTYWYNAYFQDAYPQVSSEAERVEGQLMEALGAIGDKSGKVFGGKVKDLANYHYMIFMPYFEDHLELASYDSFDDAVQTIRARLNQGVAETKPVYEVVMADQEMAVFGVGMMDKHKGTPSWVPKLIQRHVAALPYELFVVGDKAYMLHGRYRIALSWPELTMATFSNIMDAPPDTERVLGEVASGN